MASEEGFAEQVHLSLVGISQEIGEDMMSYQPIFSQSTASTSLAMQQYKSLGFMITELNQVSSWLMHLLLLLPLTVDSMLPALCMYE